MIIEERINIKASQEKIYSIYEDVSGWSEWDHDVASSSIDGELMKGSTGKLKPTKGPESKIQITEATKNLSFTTTSKLPLCTMDFAHKLIPLGDETEVIHTVSFTGVLAPIFGRLIGSGIAKGLPTSLLELKKHIESKA